MRVDKIKLQALLLRNKTVDIIQDEFAREMNRLVHEKLRQCCEACQADDFQSWTKVVKTNELNIIHFSRMSLLTSG